MPVHPPQSPNPLINIYCPHYDEAAKNVIMKDVHFPFDLPGFVVNVIPPWSNEIGYVKHVAMENNLASVICNDVHFDSDSDCTSTTRTRYPKKRYKVVKECAVYEYVGGQEHCDWMNHATSQAKQEAIPKDIQNAKSPSNDAYGKKS
ncbi:hypothetical protein C1H46_035777 [Malus baccata]|uniref:Uncharacterized protein n=1 Tax=Malus baccata TaxID=106549 RepID=A0A540KXC9_MALBA|nr:hypothetical protein C1H46_035777 [Malus baccata]